ncbi:MAG TPA: hypothetical protein DEB39_00880 [Planctomycetaceae bacterium]|nr:hypothetical protein [Planctomycetaceae bacterium]
MQKQFTAFTLLELLAVLLILVALFAILATTIRGRITKAYRSQAEIQIGNFKTALEQYQLEKGTYPSTEQGLNALIFIPNNERNAVTTTLSPGMAAGAVDPMNPGGMYPGGLNPDAMNPNGMNPVAVGADPLGTSLLNSANPMDPMADPGGMTPGGTPAVDPFAIPGTMGGAMSGPMGAGVPGMSNWQQTTFNPQLYSPLVKRATPYFESDKGEIPLDPWGRPYHYVYAPVNGVNPLTGENKPAIWSDGPTEDTADDIRNWNPATVASVDQLNPANPMYPQGQPGVNPMDSMNPGGIRQDPFGAMQQNPVQPVLSQPNLPQPGPMLPGPMLPGANPLNPMSPALPLQPDAMPPNPMPPPM